MGTGPLNSSGDYLALSVLSLVSQLSLSLHIDAVKAALTLNCSPVPKNLHSLNLVSKIQAIKGAILRMLTASIDVKESSFHLLLISSATVDIVELLANHYFQRTVKILAAHKALDIVLKVTH